MSQSEAEAAARVIHEMFPEVYADVVDPSEWFPLILERTAVEALRAAAIAMLDSGETNGRGKDAQRSAHREGLSNLVQEFDRWLTSPRPPR
jgi:hypothetical protein